MSASALTAGYRSSAPTAGDAPQDVSERHERARKIKPQLAEGPLVRVAGARNQAEGEFIQGLLLEEGVPSMLRRTAGFDVPDFLAAGPRDVMVPQAGFATAREILLAGRADRRAAGRRRPWHRSGCWWGCSRRSRSARSWCGWRSSCCSAELTPAEGAAARRWARADALGVAERLLAIQAQDERATRLAIRARTRGLSAVDVDRALTADRSLLITWLNRGTLHLVRREDYGWLHALTTPPLLSANARRLAQEGASPSAAERGVKAIERALASEGPLTRGQLGERLASAGVRTEGQALVHVLGSASHRGLMRPRSGH